MVVNFKVRVCIYGRSVEGLEVLTSLCQPRLIILSLRSRGSLGEIA